MREVIGSTTKHHLASLFLVQILACQTPALASLSTKDIEAKIVASKILPAGAKVLINVSPGEAVISKYVSGKSKTPEKDLKIEAVLLGKTVMDADPSVKRVRSRSFDKTNPGSYSNVSVRIGDIKAFASGVMNETDLLASLEIEKGTDFDNMPPAESGSTSGASSATTSTGKAGTPVAEVPISVVPGPMENERAALLRRINKLAGQGVNTKPYSDYFEKLETTAKGGSATQTRNLLDSLSGNVGDQEKTIARKGQARVPSNSISSNLPPPPPGGSPAAAVTETITEDDERSAVLDGFIGEMRKRLVFKPKPGLYLAERSLIAHKIVMSPDAERYKPMFLKMESFVVAGNNAELHKSILSFVAALHIGQSEIDGAKDRYTPGPGRGGRGYGQGFGR